MKREVDAWVVFNKLGHEIVIGGTEAIAWGRAMATERVSPYGYKTVLKDRGYRCQQVKISWEENDNE